MAYIEIALFMGVIITLAFTYVSMVKHPYDAVALYLYLFTLLFVGRQGLLMFGLDTPMPDYLFPFDVSEERTQATAAVLVWSIGFYSAMWVNRAVGISDYLAKLIPESSPHISFNKLLLATAFFVAASLGTSLYLISIYGMNVGVISYAIRLERIFSGFSFVLVFGVLGAYLCMVTAFTFVVHQRQKQDKFPTAWFVFLSILGILCMLTAILTADRDNLVFTGLFYILGISLYVVKIPFALIVPATGLAIWLLVFLKHARMEIWGNESHYGNIFREVSTGLNLEFYDSFLLLIKHWGNAPARMGEDFILGVVGVIPRSLWPAKPLMVDPGIWLTTQFIVDANYGWPISVVGEWWFNFRMPGVLIGGLLSGIIYLAISINYKNFTVNPLAFMAVFMLATRVFPMGYNATSPMKLIITMVPVFAILFFVRKIKVL